MKKVSIESILEAYKKNPTNKREAAKSVPCQYGTYCSKLKAYNATQAIKETSPEPVAISNIGNLEASEEKATYKAMVAKEENITKLNSNLNSAGLVPEVDKDYKFRPLDQVIEKYAERSSDAVCLIGEAGTGKTYTIMQYAARKKLPFLRVACDDASILKEYLGRREIRNGTTLFKNGLLVDVMQQESVILIDEFNSLPSSRLFFLHELLDNRRIFIKDTDEIIQAHPKCHIFLACNPNTARYSGTNRINVALASRVKIIEVPAFDIKTVKTIFDCGKKEFTEQLEKFYTDANKAIHGQNLRITFSLRSVKRIAEAIKAGDSIEDALAHNFYNMALLTASDTERNGMKQLASVIFGIKS